MWRVPAGDCAFNPHLPDSLGPRNIKTLTQSLLGSLHIHRQGCSCELAFHFPSPWPWVPLLSGSSAVPYHSLYPQSDSEHPTQSRHSILLRKFVRSEDKSSFVAQIELVILPAGGQVSPWFWIIIDPLYQQHFVFGKLVCQNVNLMYTSLGHKFSLPNELQPSHPTGLLNFSFCQSQGKTGTNSTAV